MTRDDRSRQDALHRHWDALVQGASGADAAADPALAEAVRRLRALDDAPGPDAGFIRRLRRDLLGSRQTGGDAHAAVTAPPVPQITSSPSEAPRERVTPPARNMGQHGKLRRVFVTGANSIAAAAVLVVFLGALVLFFQGMAGREGGAGAPASPTPGLERIPTEAVAAASPPGCLPFQSAGLGLSRQQWEARVGPPTAVRSEGRPGGAGSQAPDIVSASYPAPRGTYEVRFADGLLFLVRYQLDEGVTLSLDEAHALVRPLLPGDAQLLRQAEFQDGKLLREGYGSASLAFELARRAGSRIEGCALPGGIEHGVPINVVYARQDGGLVTGSISLEMFIGG